MRWLTDEARSASDTDWANAVAAYLAHLAQIGPRLPTDLMALTTDPRLNLHDGRFREVIVAPNEMKVAMVIDGGDLEFGYRRVTLQFEGATVVPDNVQLLAEAVGAEFHPNHWHKERQVTEVQDVEVDLLPDGRFSLRLRLRPFYEFAIEFSGFSLAEDPLEARGPARAGTFVVRV
jgi:hypothetical protein